MPPRVIPRVLSIAGSDSGGGAGVQADLKAFAACGVHGMTAITAITAQNTVGVTAVHAIPPEVIIAQVRAVQTDIGVDAVKIGMLGTLETIEAVATALDELPGDTPVVLDPVMVAESGAELLRPNARAALVELLLPRATVVTPNLPEARALLMDLGHGPPETSASPAETSASPAETSASPAETSAGPAETSASPAETSAGETPAPAVSAEQPGRDAERDAAALARAVRALGPEVVVVTGGHRERPVDVFFDGERLVELPGERHPDGAAHGSGCTHSSVLAARLAWGDEPLQAARTAKMLAAAAVKSGLAEIGAGPGPVDVIGLGRHLAPPATAV